jgi:N-acetylneuraminic acid mutarotase
MSPIIALPLLPTWVLFALGPHDPSPTWRGAPDMLHARSAHAVVSTGTVLYALAGTGANEPGAPTAPMLEVERFDGEAWTVETRLPGDGLNAPAAVLLGQRLFVLGGFDLLTNVPTDAVHVYDVDTREWSRVAPLPAPRGGHAAVVHDGRIHVLGGGNSMSTLADHDAYDPSTDTWTQRAALPRAEGSPAAVVFEGELWSIGGRSGLSDFGEVDLWDPSTDTWREGPSIAPRGTAGAVVYRDTIWVFGGESQELGTCLDEVLCLDRASRTWSVATRLPTPRNYARAVLFEDEVCVVGGSLSAGTSHAAAGSRVVECMSVPTAQVDDTSREATDD